MMHIYFYYNSNTGETTWALPIHRYVGHVPPSILPSSSPAGLQSRVSRREEVEVPRKVEARVKPLAMVGGIFINFAKYRRKEERKSRGKEISESIRDFSTDKWLYAPEDVAEFNTNHPVASSILYSIHEELVSLPEPSARGEKENAGATGGLDLWDLYNEVYVVFLSRYLLFLLSYILADTFSLLYVLLL